MKVVQRKIIHDAGQSLSLAHFPQLSYPLHCHEEYELVIVTAGTGREYIGHAVENDRAGDMTLIGPDIPHLHLCDSLTGKNGGEESACEILYFSPSLFPDNMDGIAEYRAIAAVLEKSRRGVRYSDPALTRQIRKKMQRLEKWQGIGRIRWLLALLDTLARSRETALIASGPVRNGTALRRQETVDTVCRYLREHFRENLCLQAIAREACMNPSALCRHFRQRTGKTLFAFLAGIRIENACRLLLETRLSVSAIAWETGFANLSHFNRQFKSLTGQTPGEYRKNIRSGVG